MLIRRHASTIMENAKDDFVKCMSEIVDNNAESSTYTVGNDNARNKCLHDYHKTLKAAVPQVRSFYEGYMLNYSKKDGSLMGGFEQFTKAD